MVKAIKEWKLGTKVNEERICTIKGADDEAIYRET